MRLFDKIPAMAKFAVVFICSCLWLQALAFSESDLEPSDYYCMEKLKLDKKLVLDSYDEHNAIKEGDAVINEFNACAWKKDDLMDDEGHIKADNLKHIVQERLKKLVPNDENQRKQLANEGVDHCKGVKGADHGDTAIKVYNCLLKKIGEFNQ